MNKLCKFICQNCGKDCATRKYKQKFCSMRCGLLKRWEVAKALGKNFNGGCPISTVSFMKLKDLAKNEVYRNARKVYLAKNPILNCKHCGCDDEEVIDIAHIKGVSLFSRDTIMLEVNQISNLTALCKNCHWKFDKHLPGKKGNKRYATAVA